MIAWTISVYNMRGEVTNDRLQQIICDLAHIYRELGQEQTDLPLSTFAWGYVSAFSPRWRWECQPGLYRNLQVMWTEGYEYLMEPGETSWHSMGAILSLCRVTINGLYEIPLLRCFRIKNVPIYSVTMEWIGPPPDPLITGISAVFFLTSYDFDTTDGAVRICGEDADGYHYTQMIDSPGDTCPGSAWVKVQNTSAERVPVETEMPFSGTLPAGYTRWQGWVGGLGGATDQPFMLGVTGKKGACTHIAVSCEGANWTHFLIRRGTTATFSVRVMCNRADCVVVPLTFPIYTETAEDMTVTVIQNGGPANWYCNGYGWIET